MVDILVALRNKFFGFLSHPQLILTSQSCYLRRPSLEASGFVMSHFTSVTADRTALQELLRTWMFWKRGQAQGSVSAG